MTATEQKRLARWSESNAWLLLVSVLLETGAGVAYALPVGALVSFAALILINRDTWTPNRRFGAANGVTLLRLCAMIGLSLPGSINPYAVILVSVLIFALDGVDGSLARCNGSVSVFGEYFDKESDALFMLVLGLLLYREQRLGLWILFPCAFRYLFVIYMQLARPPAVKERRNSFGRWVYFLVVCALIFCFSPFPLLYEPVVVFMSLMLLVSFALSFRDIYRAGGS